MLIKRYGKVIIEQDRIRVEDWLVDREPDKDPEDATNEQLLLGLAIVWARERFETEVKKAVFDVFRDLAKQKRLEELAKKALKN